VSGRRRERLNRPTALRRLPRLRAVTVSCALVALLVLGLLVQTHVHLPWLEHPMESGAWAASTADPSRDARHSVPAHGDADHCALWQALLHAGTFTCPGADVPMIVPTVWHATIEYVTARAAISVLSHDWQSRAPPRRHP